ncbi:membrane-associated protein [Hydrogenivirga sp. 128-5-R1-1]|nr:membrane-associated protein [Hydrogenivirga sp. 128-5-R1-1]
MDFFFCFILFSKSLIAILNTSSTWSTNIRFISFLANGGRSSITSSLLSLGRITSFIPALFAASIFSFSPPTGRTLPLSVISPVIATSALTGSSVNNEHIAVAIDIPAEGPSFGIAPAGTWTWTSYFWNSLGLILYSSAFDFT